MPLNREPGVPAGEAFDWHPRFAADTLLLKARSAFALYPRAGAVLLDGPDAHELGQELFPLLDGTRSAADVRAQLPHFDGKSIESLLESLKEQGALENALTDGLGERKRAPLEISCVVAEPWQRLLLPALKQFGVCVSSLTLDAAHTADLAVGIFNIEQSVSAQEFSTASYRARIPFISCIVDEIEVIFGPYVVPGESACWNCSRLRLTANARMRELPKVGYDHEPYDLDVFVAQFLAREVRYALDRGRCGTKGANLIGRLLILDKRSLRLSGHCLIGVPGCSVCGGPSRCGEIDDPEMPHASGRAGNFHLDALSRLVDPRVGIINRVLVEPASLTGLELPFIASALAADAPEVERPVRSMPVGWGKGMTLTHAVTGAVAEALERYCASITDRTRMRWCPIDKLDGEVLDPRVFALYREEQYRQSGFPFARFDPAASQPWLRARWALTGHPVWVHANLVYLWLELTDEQLFCQGSSNGLAAGFGSSSAALAAVLELIERDTFMASWLCRRPGRRLISEGGLGEEERTVIEGVRSLGGQVEIVLLEGVCSYSTALCLAFGDGEHWPGVTIGLGADRNPRVAVRRAILEQGQTGPYLRRLLKTSSYPVPRDAHAVRTMLDHAAYYFPPDRAAAFHYLLEGEPIYTVTEVSEGGADSIDSCSRALAAAGIRVALVDVTSADVAATSLRVVRAISPDLQNISFGDGMERLPVARLVAAASKVDKVGVLPVW